MKKGACDAKLGNLQWEMRAGETGFDSDGCVDRGMAGDANSGTDFDFASLGFWGGGMAWRDAFEPKIALLAAKNFLGSFGRARLSKPGVG